jgi:UDP-glucose 4-epimerase
VYGDSKNLPLSEDEHVVPNSPYGADKLSNEVYAKVMSNAYSIPSIGLRLFNVYGPGQLPTSSYSGVITSFKRDIKLNKPLTIFGDGLQTRDFIYVNDVVEAFMLAAATPYEKTGVYNICNGQAISILKLAAIMKSIAASDIPIVHQPVRKNDLRHSLGSKELAQRELNFVAKTPMDVGLSTFIKDNNLI